MNQGRHGTSFLPVILAGAAQPLAVMRRELIWIYATATVRPLWDSI
jgi:hypothetical protein